MPRNSGGGPPPPHNNQGGPGGWGHGLSQFSQRPPMSRGYNNEMGAAYGSYTVSVLNSHTSVQLMYTLLVYVFIYQCCSTPSINSGS